LIEAGAKLLLGNDAGIIGPNSATSPMWGRILAGPDAPSHLGTMHLHWLKAAIERGMSPMDTLLAATRNIAQAYRKDDELGTISPGKRADLLVLHSDPLEDVESYGRIALVVKDGRLIDRDRLPEHPVLTRH
jgi:imidazolonepropionase-like amidohydrolase